MEPCVEGFLSWADRQVREMLKLCVEYRGSEN